MTASDGSPLALTPHRLRHTLATEMLNQGVSQRAIQDYLDHSSPDMTAVYAKLLDSTLRAEFDAYQQRVNIRGERTNERCSCHATKRSAPTACRSSGRRRVGPPLDAELACERAERLPAHAAASALRGLRHRPRGPPGASASRDEPVP
jgi:hypothetical protein